MLKTLQISSRVVVALAVCGVVFVVIFGFRGDPESAAYLKNPGIIEQLKSNAGEGDKKEVESPLVGQAHAFALRIDPPAPPKPVEQPKVNPDVIRVVRKEEPPRPKTPVSATFELLATVQCETAPSRSMVLLKQATGEEKWFWLGEKVGHLKIDEVRNGSAIFSQDGRSTQEMFVPAKPRPKSLLKSEAQAASLPDRTGGIEVQPGEGSLFPVTTETTAASPKPDIHLPSSVRPPSKSPRNISERIQRIRSASSSSQAKAPVRDVPQQPTAEEEKASLEKSISSIQEIMAREDSGEDQQADKEAWMELIQTLQAEKESLEAAAEPSGPQEEPEDDTEASEIDAVKNEPNQP